MKRQPRKLKWTKTHRALRGKEMIVDQSLLLSQFAKVRNAPVKYDRNLMASTLKAMERIEEIRAKRERAFTRRRLTGKAQREKKRMADLKVIATGEHLIAKELADMERVKLGEEVEEQVQTQSNLLGEERIRQKTKRKLLVNGGVTEENEMDVD